MNLGEAADLGERIVILERQVRKLLDREGGQDLRKQLNDLTAWLIRNEVDLGDSGNAVECAIGELGRLRAKEGRTDAVDATLAKLATWLLEHEVDIGDDDESPVDTAIHHLEVLEDTQRLLQDKLEGTRSELTNAREELAKVKFNWPAAGDELLEKAIKIVDAAPFGPADKGVQQKVVRDIRSLKSGEGGPGVMSEEEAGSVLKAWMDVLINHCAKIVEKAYGKGKASEEIRSLGSEAVTATYSDGSNRSWSVEWVKVQDLLERAARIVDDVEQDSIPALREAAAEIRALWPGKKEGLYDTERSYGVGQTAHQARVEKMMKGYGQEVPEKPTLPDRATRVLRARLIMEEVLELIQKGLRVSPELSFDDEGVGGEPPAVRFSDLVFVAKPGPADLVEIADGCADVSVVTIGTLSACGIADKDLLEVVDMNNLAKIEKGHEDEHGKWIKPQGHKPPDIAGVLRDQGWGYQGLQRYTATLSDKVP